MVIKSNLNIDVSNEITELIESTATNTLADRIFSIGNREKDIEVTAWGSNDSSAWELIQSKTIIALGYETIELDVNHFINCKLTGKTINQGETSKVDAFFNYTPS